MNDETAGKPIKEFVGLRSKMYSLLVDGKEKKTAKGIKKSVIRRDLYHAAYRDVLLNEAVTRATMNLIQSHHHKLALLSFDDKRYVLDDKVHTCAHGHYRYHLNVLLKMNENKFILVIFSPIRNYTYCFFHKTKIIVVVFSQNVNHTRCFFTKRKSYLLFFRKT